MLALAVTALHKQMLRTFDISNRGGGKVRNKHGNVLCHAAFHRMMGGRFGGSCFVSIQGNVGRNTQYHFP